MNESQANETMFDLMIEANKGGTGAAFINRFLLMAVVVLLVDHFMPTHPLSRLIYGSKGPNFVERTVKAGDETKIVYLPDSYRVELMPHSKIGFPNSFFWSGKRVELTGSAKFDVRVYGDYPFYVRSGDIWLETHSGSFEHLNPFNIPLCSIL